jgi:hypothetical protein
MTDSPLAEAEPRSLDELYAADPLSLTDSDVDKIVTDLCEKRDLWMKEEKEAGAQGRKRKTKVYKEAPKPGELSLGGLGIIMPGQEGT